MTRRLLFNFSKPKNFMMHVLLSSLFLLFQWYHHSVLAVSLNSKVVISSASNSDSIYVGTPVLLQIYAQGPPWSNIYAFVDWDEFSVSGLASYNYSTITSASETFSHIYSSAGIKKVKVVLSDRPITISNPIPETPLSYSSLDSDSEVSKPYSFIFQVYAKTSSCFNYNANVQFFRDQANGNLQSKLFFKLSDPTSTIDSSNLSNLFYNFGHTPSIVLYNDTFSTTLSPTFNTDIKQWELDIPTIRLQSEAEVMVNIIPDTISIFQCTASPLTISVHPLSYKFTDWGITSLDKIATSISSSALQLRWITNPCVKSHIILFPNPPTADLQFLYTFDAFKSYSVYSFKSICLSFLSTITSCSNFVVHDIHFISQNMFLLHTSAGLLKSSPLFGNVSKIDTGLAIIDSGNAMNFAPRSCNSYTIALQSTSSFIYSSWLTKTNSFATWISKNIPTGSELIDSYFSDFTNSWVMLMKSSVNGNFIFSTIDINNTVLYTFPSNTLLKGFALSFHGTYIYAFGSHLFHSVQNGNGKHWILDYTLPLNTGQLSGSPYGTSFISLSFSSVGEQLLLITDIGKVFYTKAHTNNFILLPHMHQWAIPTTTFRLLFNYFFDCAGKMYFATFIFDSDGSQLFYKRNSVPLYSLLYSQDMLDTFSSFLYFGYIPTGIQKVTLRGLNSTGDRLNGTFRSSDIGMVLNNKNGNGELVAQDLDEDGVELELYVKKNWEPFISGTDSITVVSLSQTNHFSLTFSNTSVLNSAVLGTTLVLNNVHSLFIKAITSTSTVTGLLLSPFSFSSSWTNVSFRFFDFKSLQMVPLALSSTITLISNTPLAQGNNVTLQTSFQLNPSLHTNLFFQLNTNLGMSLLRMLQIDSNFLATAQIMNAQSDLIASSPFSASNVMLFPASYLSPSLIKPYRSWFWTPDTCMVQNFELSSDLRAFYFFYADDLTLNVSLAWTRMQSFSFSSPPGNVDLLFIDSSSFGLNVSYSHVENPHQPVSKVQLDLSHRNHTESKVSVISIRPSPFSLACRVAPPVLKIVNDCHPSFQIFYVFSQPDSYTLKNAIDKNNLNYKLLEPNYRPPSHLGYSVPITSNFYNAYPELPKYNNFMAISKNTGVFKNCFGKHYREECGCSSYLKTSQSIEDSDCIDRVLTLSNEERWTPSFVNTYDMNNFVPLNQSFYITELNNRTDWCFGDSNVDCKFSDVSYQVFFNTSSGFAFQWKGQELYHFRFTFKFDTYCEKSIDLPVYITSFSAPASVQQSYMAITAIAFCLFFLSVYIWFSMKQT